MPPLDEPRLNEAEADRLGEAVGRMLDAFGQMRTRSGPYYELARERSPIVAEAYRLVGSPRKVSLSRTAAGWSWFFTATLGGPDPEPAPPGAVAAWQAWWRQRDAIRQSLGSQRGQGKPPPDTSSRPSDRPAE